LKRKLSVVIATVFVLVILAFTFNGGTVVSAWSAGASYTCVGISTTTCLSSGQKMQPSFTVGTTVNDTAIIKDPNGINGKCTLFGGTGCVTGNVIFTIYQGLSCSTDRSKINVVATSSQIGPTGKQYPGIFSWTPGYTFTTIGSYSFQAQYKGNYNDNNGWFTLPCEPFQITKASPTISTLLSSSTIVVGNSVYDTASLSGGYMPTGTVQYEYFSGSSCAGSPTLVGSSVTISKGTVPNSGSVTFNSAGSYSWQAVYSGDANNMGSTSACEPLTVSVTTPTISTTLSTSQTGAGESLYDTATLSGVTSSAGGTITFYYSTTSSCPSGATEVGSVTVSGPGTYTSKSEEFTKGDYYWCAAYSGDSNNGPAVSPIASEPLIVTPQFPLGTLVAALAPLAAIGLYVGTKRSSRFRAL
jgi:hypothetical protein